MKQKMYKKSNFVFLVAILALAIVAPMTAACSGTSCLTLDLANVRTYVDGLNAGSDNVAVTAGDLLPVEVKFTALETAENVEISAWIQGEKEDKVTVDFGDILNGSKYTSRLSVQIPELYDETEKDLTLYVRIESDSGTVEKCYTLKAQRPANELVVLLVDFDNTVKAGNTLPISVVLKNAGRHEAKDILVNVKIAELGISRTLYFEDLTPTDVCDVADDCDSVDSRERTLFLTIPEGVDYGTYTVEVTASSKDFKTTVSKTLEVSETPLSVSALSSPASRTFAVGEEATYELVLVNSGNEIAVFNLAPEASDALKISLSDSLVAVPAGSSKTVTVSVTANREGTFGFAVNVIGDKFTERADFSATAEGKTFTSVDNVVALTIVLAIIFVVLVVILIVLLTRKQEKSEEFGESYY